VFTSLARQAGKGLSGPRREDLFVCWLDALKQYAYGKDSIAGSGTISESRASELRISDELVPPRCGLRFVPSPGWNWRKHTPETGEHEAPVGLHIQFIEKSTSYLIEDVFRTSANFCLELISRSTDSEMAGSAGAGSDRSEARANDGEDFRFTNVPHGSERGIGNVYDAAYGRDHPHPLLRCVKAARLFAMETLSEEAKGAIERAAPKTPDEAAKLLRPAISKYAKEVFDKRAGAKLREVVPLARSGTYGRWLRSKCLSAVVEDVCRPLCGQFQITVRHIADFIGDRRPTETFHALWRILAREWESGSFSDDLRTRLSKELEGRSLYWEAQSVSNVKKTSSPKADPAAGGQSSAAILGRGAGRKRLKPKPSVLPANGTVNKKTAAEALGVTVRTIERMSYLPIQKTHTGNRYKVTEIRRILDERGVRQARQNSKTKLRQTILKCDISDLSEV
jgi:hypothetical protein